MTVLGIVCALCAGGCVKNSGSFEAGGFQHETYPYRVVGAQGNILDASWRLDNFRRRKGGKLEAKQTEEFLSTFHLDSNDDGKAEEDVLQPTYDLRYEHRQRGGVIWLRTFPISGHLSHKELRVLMQSFIDEIAGANYERAALDQKVVVEQRYAAEIRERGTATLAGHDAHVSTIDVANIDQIRLSPSSRRTRVRLVMARPGFLYESGSRNDKRSYPVLMMAGYANLPEDFDRDLPSFDDFLGKIEISGRRGWLVTGLQTLLPGPAAPTPAPSGTAPSAPAIPAPK